MHAYARIHIFTDSEEEMIMSNSTFNVYPYAKISTDTSCPVDESVDFEAIRERLMKMTDDPHMKRIISHFGRITDPTFRRHPDFVVPSFEEEE